ncbi:MAG: DeoR family transcriptional regulator [Thermotogaceae bacterium]|nr:DeoR family transcriptional regulator [Thermotogaceae bacterium]
MKKKKSFLESLVAVATTVGFIGLAGYLVYRKVVSGSPSLEAEKKDASEESSCSDVNMMDSRPKGAISRRKDMSVLRVADKGISKKDLLQPKVEWIPNLRVREKKILSIIPSNKDVSMSDVQDHFPDVTVRTLRRDMERLVQKGRVLKSGTTRATTYRKV